ncbi:MAG: T9SS type A sorting domain-containing protein [bacterium]
MLRTIQIGLAMILLLGIASLATAQIHISGPQTGTLSAATYIVDGDISVPVGQSLTIQPGAVFLFNGAFSFTVNGYLFAIGTAADSIKFQTNTSIPNWAGIEFTDSASDNSEIGYCRIAGSNSSGLSLNQASPAIHHSTFTGNTAQFGGAIYVNNATLQLNNSVISYNTGFTGAGLYGESNAFFDIHDSEFLYNVADWHGGGMYTLNASADVYDSYFEGNRGADLVRAKGGGISTEYATLRVQNCEFTLNYAGLSGGAVGMVETQGTISGSVFYANSTPNQGGAIMLKYTTATVVNCTIDDNTTVIDGGAISATRDSFLTLRNSTVTNSHGPNAIALEASASASLNYNLIYGNEGVNFSGSFPAGLGQITTVNANGDPSDAYYNIFLAPQYVNQPGRDYNLQSTSPCIDAGNPTTPLDPDGTVADIGAFYFAQGAPALTVALTPHNPPIQIPASGGSFQFDISIQNSGGSSLTFDVWTVILRPNGAIYGPIIQRDNVTISAGGTISRTNLSQFITAGTASGQYSYIAYVGDYPANIIDSDSFTFVKLSSVDAFNAGIATLDAQSQEFSIAPAYPNPFNPETTLSFTLPQAAQVTLKVFDANGRQMVTLLNGWRDSGTHEITFDASHLAAGVYVARLQAGDFQTTQKLVLLK